MKLSQKEKARLDYLIASGEFERLRAALTIEMSKNPKKFDAKRRKYGFPLDEVLVLREMFAEWHGAEMRHN